MDQEHPIPQQISAYQFRLVGDMTLKQFFQVAAGVLISLVLYSSNLAPYIKWPLIVLSFLAGIAFAFFPLEDRPLSKWVFLFLKAIYSPTIYTWKKQSTPLLYFQPEPTPQPSSLTQSTVAGSSNSQTAQELTPKEFEKFEQREKEFISKVSEQFESSSRVEPKIETQVELPTKIAQVTVPKRTAPTIEKSEKDTAAASFQPQQSVSSVGSEVTRSVGEKVGDIKVAEFSQEASPPAPPTQPNLIVGQVIDFQGKIVENAILEIKDSEGRSARALKSNKLGHFMIVTPLSNGKYEIITEKEGFTFERLSFDARGEIIPPIFVKAKNPELTDLGINQQQTSKN